MKPLIISASKIIDAPANVLYRIIADYQNGHASILPKSYFSSLEVEKGGYGEGTIIRYQMRVLGRTQTFRALITEPDPGCTLLETDLESSTSTSFTVWSLGNKDHSRVTIMTVLKNRSFVDGFLAKIFLTNVYRQELDLLSKIAKPSDQTVKAIHPNQHGQTKASKRYIIFMADEVNSTDPQYSHLPRNDWQILGTIKLRDNSNANGTIDHWLTGILTTFSLPDDLVGKIRTSIEDAVVRILSPDTAPRNFEYLEIVVLGPSLQTPKGHPWGFFLVERASTDPLNERSNGHCVEYYLYLDKKAGV